MYGPSRTTLVALLALSGLVGTPAPSIHAAGTTITVTSVADVVADDGVCTLPKAVASANSGTASGAAAGECVAGGTGDLYWSDASLNGGLGDWALAQKGVSYTINFYDSGKSGKSSTDTFGIRIVYTPVAPQPSVLPNATPQLLKGGDIKEFYT